jgi:NADH dehydrogenase FAD-containing subunit
LKGKVERLMGFIGAVGIEMAAELKHIYPSKSVKLIHSHEKLLSSEPLPDELRDTTLSLVQEAGVEVLLNQRVINVTEIKHSTREREYKVILGGGKSVLASHVTWAISRAVPTTNYLPASTLDSNRLVQINARMNFLSSTPNSSHHFAVGDLVSRSGIKRCGAAMAMGHNAAFNIHQQLLEAASDGKHKAEFIELPEVPAMIALAVGRKAVSYSPGNGVQEGVEVMRSFFGEDLGLKSKWDKWRRGKGGANECSLL